MFKSAGFIKQTDYAVGPPRSNIIINNTAHETGTLSITGSSIGLLATSGSTSSLRSEALVCAQIAF